MTTWRPRAVVVFSLSLFAILFVVFALQLGAQAAPAKRAKPAAKASSVPAEATAGETEEPAAEYAETKVESLEPEVEEVPPVVTGSS